MNRLRAASQRLRDFGVSQAPADQLANPIGLVSDGPGLAALVGAFGFRDGDSLGLTFAANFVFHFGDGE